MRTDPVSSRRFLCRAVLGLITLLSFQVNASEVPLTALCPAWGQAVEVGTLDPKIINEASGLAVSREFNRLYHINDSGDGPFFYITQRDGSKTQKVAIKGYEPRDIEAISIGKCPKGSGSCLAIGDFGNNLGRRKSVEIVFVKEEERFPEETIALHRLTFRYPDGSHDAEALAILPNGDIVIITKKRKLGTALAAGVYRAKHSDLFKGKGKTIKLAKIGEIDVPALTGDDGFGSLVTDMSVTSDGSRFVLLTYNKAIEFTHDLSNGPFPKHEDLKAGRDYSLIDLKRLAQQEAISYEVNDRDLIYTSEVVRWFQRVFRETSSTAPIMRISCR